MFISSPTKIRRYVNDDFDGFYLPKYHILPNQSFLPLALFHDGRRSSATQEWRKDIAW